MRSYTCMKNTGKNIFAILLVSGMLLLFLSACDFGWVKTKREGVFRDPIQNDQVAKQSFKFKECVVIVQAGFDIEARVLSRHRYFFGREAKFSPIDLALGWQEMSRREVLDKMVIYQMGRWYFYRYKTPPIPVAEIVNQSANMHLIPQTGEIERTIKKARRGNIVHFKGFLVSLKADDGWYWNSSLTRSDSGNHSCEVVFVTEFRIVE